MLMLYKTAGTTMKEVHLMACVVDRRTIDIGKVELVGMGLMELVAGEIVRFKIQTREPQRTWHNAHVIDGHTLDIDETDLTARVGTYVSCHLQIPISGPRL
jgi:hypothetical protein